MKFRIMLLTKYPSSEIHSIFRSRSVLTITPRIIPSVQQQSRTEATLPLPQEIWQVSFLSTKQGRWLCILTQSLYISIAWFIGLIRKNPAEQFMYLETKFISQFPSKLKSCTCSPFFREWSPDSFL